MNRVGIVAKTRLQAAAQHLVQAASWLEARKIEPVFDPESAALADTAGAAGRFKALDKDALAAQVDMVLVLGGDGTLLGMAGRIGRAGSDIPILGVNFGSLGFLTEVTLPEMYASLEARSEEHTSELQSPCNLVCRRLLEKKKSRLYYRLLVHQPVYARAAKQRARERPLPRRYLV